ncbi:hypothetical protein, partial [Burkholderia contaminans]|uniref:hypothetical protein n=1 Tax=Burkholderia contaminans TaxID=488447 RepID=UPI001C2E6E0C
LETRFSRIPLANRRLQPSTTPGTLPDRERIENILGEQSWSLEQQGFVVSAHDDPGPLARDVYEWASVD